MDSGWEKDWINLEKAGNVGHAYSINPILYLEIVGAMADKKSAHMLDIGAGTHALGRELLYTEPSTIPGLASLDHLDHARSVIQEIIGIEDADALIRIGNEYIHTLHAEHRLPYIPHYVNAQPLPVEARSIDCVVSRHFLMHLSIEDMRGHMDAVRQVLRANGTYIISMTNPQYEQYKWAKHNPIPLRSDQEYRHAFVPESTEANSFRQYYKDTRTIEKLLSTCFEIKKKIPCTPISSTYRMTHPQYYMNDIPMSFVYVLEPK